MKKLLLGIILFLIPSLIVNANSISNIDMDIYIDKNGNAYITETWNSYVNSGTEGYHPYYNLGNASISDLSVKMDGEEYTTISNWNINASMKDKANKAGFYYPDANEVDICFGLTSYGRHIYEIKYKINGFVLKANDADIVYWTLMPHNFSVEPNNVHIKIYSDEPFSDTLDVWGYGQYGGYAYVYDGYIEMSTNGSLKSDEYMTVLVKFPKNTFNTSHVSSNNFDHYHDMAEEGAEVYEGNNSGGGVITTISIILGVIVFFIPLIIFGIIIVIVAMFASNDQYVFGTKGQKIKKGVLPFRDIPCNKDIFRAYFVASIYNLNNKKEDLLGSILLKWLKDGNVRAEKIEKKTIFSSKTVTNIIFVNQPKGNSEELKLYNWMNEASIDGKLEEKEFQRWCNTNYKKILNWFDDVMKFERDLLVEEGKITIEEKTTFKFFKSKSYVVSDSMMIEAEQMAGLKKFLKEFTMIKAREPIEVKLWNEYLMYAQIFGIAKEVAKQFKNLYPEIIQDINSLGYDYDTIIFVHLMANSGVRSASTAKSRAESYHSGGGGFSSGGGGGGSFGGGGGGGGFR